MKYNIESILEMYEDDYNPSSKVPGPRNMKLAEVPRSEMDNFNTPDLEQSPDSFLRPGETLEDFDVEFRRPNAQGGVQQLVSNTVDGSRPGYNGRGGARPNTGGDRSEFIDYEARIKNPGKKKLDIAEKVHGNKPEYKGLKGFELWKKLKNFQRSNIVQESTTGKPVFKPKKNQLGKDDFIKLVSDNKGKTYNEFVEIIKKFKTKDGQPFTKQIIADRLRSYKLSGSFKKEPPKGPDNIKKAETEKKRKLNLKEVDSTKAKGVGDFQYHHVRQIAGGVPLTTDDVLIINKRINAQIGGATNKTLNRISEAIRKNNKLALEAMNAKNEGLALDYIKRVDELNANAEKIVNSAIDKLPKKYKGYVGFNQVTLPTNEYGLPISNEPMIIKKVGGMPVSKDAIDLTTLNLEQEAEFRKIVRAQAETGKTGKINPKEMSRLRDVINDAVGELACGDKLAGGGRIKFNSGSSCNVRGRKILTDAMRNGISSIEPSKQNLVKRILSGSANLVKGVLDPKEFFKLKNLIGFPAAVAAVAYDTVMVADDMIRKGQPFDEAAGNEMLAGMLNLQPQVQEAKRVLADPKSSLSPAAKKYAEMLVDIGEYNNTLQTKNIPMKTVGMPGDPKEQKMLEKKLDALDKKISGTSTSGELDYLKEITERDAKDKAGSYVGEGGNEYGYTRTNALYDDPDKTDAPSFFSGQLKPSYGDLEQKPGQLPGYATKMIPAYVSQNYKTMEEQPITKDWLNVITQIKRKQGELGANQNLDDIKYMNERFIKNNEGVPTKQKVKGLSMLDEMQLQNKWMQALSQPGIKGTQFSEGGITTLRSKYEYKK